MIRMIFTTTCVAVLVLSVVRPAEGRPPSTRPNILFAFADDWGRCAGAYARGDGPGGINDVVRTPNFDRIAQGGVLFNNAFVNAPSCTPCRSSLLSGRYFWQTGRGAILQGAVWDSKIPSWPLLLKDSGYHIGKTWKVWSPGTPRDAPFGGRAHAFEKSGGRFNRFSQTVTQLIAGNKSIEQAKELLMADVRGNFASFIAARDENQPFCYWFGPTNVHRKWTKGSGKRLWNIDPDLLKGKLPPYLPDVPEVREDLADYFGEIAAFDAALGVLVKELERLGERENTIIVISGDHGPPGFPHGKCNLYDFGTRVPLVVAGPGIRGGRVVDDFTMLPDLGPTFLEAGDVKVPAGMTARSLWSVLKSKREGLVDPARTEVFTGRERHVRIARAGNLPYPQRSIRTADHLLVVNFRPNRFPLGDPYRLAGDNPPTVQQLEQSTFVTLPDEDAGPTKAWLVERRNDAKWKPYFEHAYGKRPRHELFDLKRDPHQMKNVAGEKAYAKIRDQLLERLMTELRRTNDPRLKDNGRFFETPPMAGPASRKKKRKGVPR